MTTTTVTDLVNGIVTTVVSIENNVKVDLVVPVILTANTHAQTVDATQWVITGYTPNYHGNLGLYLRTTQSNHVSYVTKSMKEWVAFFDGKNIDRSNFQKEWAYLDQSIFQYL